MITCTPGQEQMIAAALASHAALTTEQKAALVAELTGDPEDRGYATPIAAANWQRVIELLVGHYTVQQAEQHALKSVVTGPEIRNWLAPLRVKVRMSTASDALKAAWLGIMSDWSVVADTYTFDPATSTTWQSLVSQVVSLVDAGGNRIITEADLLALTSTLVPAQMVTASPRLSVVLGPGMVVEVGDLATLRAEELI